MNDITDTLETTEAPARTLHSADTVNAVALAIWTVLRMEELGDDAPKPGTPEFKAAWAENKVRMMRTARGVLRRMDVRGFEVTRK